LRVAIKPIVLCNLASKLICVCYSIELLSLYSLDLTETLSLPKLPDFEILAFPCNQFLRQEPGTAEQAKDFACTRFKAEYPVFQKVRTVCWTCLLVQKLLINFLIFRRCHGV
jgi:glutathione peroxidase-family protein